VNARPTTVTGRELYGLLPSVYRERDADGHLAAYLDACGAVLDRLRATLEQRLADAFPASPPEAMPAQGWLLPYVADLLDVRLVSPLVEGRRAEVERALTWRQRKGTLRAVQEIGERLGGGGVEVQEGWRRVAVTPRIDRPLLPAAAYGEPEEPDPANPLVSRRHPGLPAVTVDVGRRSRAVVAEPDHPRARTRDLHGEPVVWRQLEPQGAPCYPGTHEDVTRRTPDVRTPGPSGGHVHPRRLLLFVPPSTGCFPADRIELAWGERHQPQHDDHLSDPGGDPRVIVGDPQDLGVPTVVVTTSPPAFSEQTVTIEDLVVDGTVRVPAGGHVVLRRAAIKRLIVDTDDVETPVIDAVDCLFDTVEAPEGLVRMLGTTVMERLTCRRLQASDAILPGPTLIQRRTGDPRSCVRHSRVPPALASAPVDDVETVAITDAEPIFAAFDHCAREGGVRPVERFGDPGYGVLDPATTDRIRFGAEDGGELGADHHRATSLMAAAILAKLEEFLPLGIEAVLVPDARLLVEPPRIAP
jgi:hypothetical protein